MRFPPTVSMAIGATIDTRSGPFNEASRRS
jgi:hypothetical protein